MSGDEKKNNSHDPSLVFSHILSTTRLEAMALKPWPSMGLFLLGLIIISLTVPADGEAGPSCDDLIGETLLDIISIRCLDPIDKGVCCRALSKGLERSKGNKCLCESVETVRLNGDSLAKLCKLSDLTKQICGS